MTEQSDERDDGSAQGDESPDHGESSWWEATREELELVAAERRETGWEVLALRASETVPALPEAGAQDRFGLTYTLTDSEADQLVTLLENTTIDEFEAYRRTVGTTCFLVTELRDTETRQCVLVAGAYDVGAAEELANHAAEVGHLFTRFQYLDGTSVAEIRHDSYEKLLPPSLTD